MSSVVQYLAERKRFHPPSWMTAGAVAYETIMGSEAYGVSRDSSDQDIYGFCIPPREMVFPHLAGEISGFGTPAPRFEQLQEHHIEDPDALGGTGRSYDVTIYSIVKYFQLAMENNPNIIDSLFTPQTCVRHATAIGQLVRERRREFLHKGAWLKFKGYAYTQMHKMDIKTPQPGSKRAADVDEHGFDCYDESQTEFLTQRGWRRFDDVTEDDELAGVELETGSIVFSRYMRRVDRAYTGRMYTIEPFLSRCVVTEQHQMLVSPMYRNESNNYSTTFDASRAAWQLRPLACLLEGQRGSKKYRSFFHIRRQGYSSNTDYKVEDEYLRLAGLYLSEGSTNFRDGKVKSIRFTQTAKGKDEFFAVADSLSSIFPIRRYNYQKESIWVLHGEIARHLHNDFAHGSKAKRLPNWCFRLSLRQANILWESMCLGDGTKARNGEVYYTSSKQLADDVQAMLTLTGLSCSVRGPYENKTVHGIPLMYQVFRSSTATPEHYVNFGRVWSESSLPTVARQGWPVKVQEVVDQRVVCFTVPCRTLITRSQGRVAIQGNCKFAYHVVRMLDEIEQILTHGDLDLQRNREQLKAIRRGEWTIEQVREHFALKERHLETLYQKSALPEGPGEPRLRGLLLDCLEMHYGSLEGAVVNVSEERELLRQIKALCERANL